MSGQERDDYAAALAAAGRRVHVAAYHNTSTTDSVWTPYELGQPLTLVFACDITGGTASLDPFMDCEWVYRLLNVGHEPEFGPPHPLAVEYRQRGNRSFSMGDVVKLTPFGGRDYWFALERCGWTLLLVRPTLAPEARPGTAPLG